MRAKDTVRCTNCRRLQARVDALEAELAALKQVVAQLGQQLAARARTPRPPPSHRPPTSSSRPSRHRRRARTGAASAGQPGHPKHERAAFPPEAINGGAFDHRLDSCPCCGHDLRPALTIPPRVVQQVDVREVPLSIQEHRSHPGWCPRCQKMHEAPLPPGIAAWRPGRAVADHADRLPQGGLPRLLLHRPQVPPRRRAGDDLARGTGPDHRQGQPGAGATLSRSCSTTCPARRG